MQKKEKKRTIKALRKKAKAEIRDLEDIQKDQKEKEIDDIVDRILKKKYDFTWLIIVIVIVSGGLSLYFYILYNLDFGELYYALAFLIWLIPMLIYWIGLRQLEKKKEKIEKKLEQN